MAHGKYFRLSLGIVVLFQVLAGVSGAQERRKFERILIETPKPYDRVIRAIRNVGGRVTHEFKHVDGIAAEIPEGTLEALRASAGQMAVDKDVDVSRPVTMGPARLRTVDAKQFGALATASTKSQAGIASVDLATFADEYPEAYSLNNAGTQIEKLQARGFTGEGTIVAVVDSGVRPGFSLLSDALLGGVDFVDDGEPGPAGDSPDDWQKDTNDGHGSFSAGLITGNARFEVSGVLQDAIERYAPEALVDGKLPLIGTAPESKLYVVRVFGDNATAGAPLATILAAIEHVIDLRQDYNHSNGRRGLKIDVCNMSFGVKTLAAGRTLLDRMIDEMLKAGIVPVVSGGNTGPSTLTTSSPGSSMSSVTVGGISRAENERILYDVLYGTEFPDFYYPGIGGDLRPFDPTQTAWFSSRGPNADGRLDPDVVAGGVANVGQGYCPDQILDACFDRLSIASGTSFSAPIVAGIAATLIQAFPDASAVEIRNAIIESGRTSEIHDAFDVHDRGNGLPNAYSAYRLLRAGKVDKHLPRVHRPNDLVRQNIEANTRLQVRSGFYSEQMNQLAPGQRGEILYEIPKGAECVTVRIDNIRMEGPQNPYYGGDALFVYIHSAKTSSIGAFGDYPVESFVLFDGEDWEFDCVGFDLADPDTGIMRITLNPDTLNAGLVSADVSVDVLLEAWPRATFEGKIKDGQTKNYTIGIQEGTTQLDFLLTWEDDWAHYPTSDIDLILFAPDGTRINAGATLAGPERVSIASPLPGEWSVNVIGFNVPSGHDEFKLRITADSEILKSDGNRN